MEMFYSLKNKDAELKACVDMNTIEDDEPQIEYEFDGSDSGIEALQSLESNEWDWISQALVDCEDDSLKVFIKEFANATLYISDDPNFTDDVATKLPTGKIVPNDYQL